MARILVIEDNPINLELMVYLLSAWGHEVATATDGDAGLALARAHRPDLVVCDIQMPGLDGYGVARALSADPGFAGVPLIAVTAFAMVGDHEKARQAGFDAHIAKPIEPAVFMAELGRFLPSARAPTPSSAEVPGLPRAVDEALKAPRPGLTLLLVDDTEANLDFKQSLFEPAGYATRVAAGGEEALGIMRAGTVDLVVSDVVMPRGDGFALLAQVRSDPALRATPFLFLTSTARDSGTRQRALDAGADGYLLRPIDPATLLAAIRRALAHRRPG